VGNGANAHKPVQIGNSIRGRSGVRYAAEFLSALLLVGVGMQPAHTAVPSSAGIEITAEIKPAETTVGDLVRYAIRVTHPAGIRANLPAVRGNTGALEVTAYAVDTDTAPDGRFIDIHTLTLAAYAVGRDTVPPQRVEFRAAGDTGVLVLYTPATTLAVRPTTPRGARDIADIEDDERLPRPFPWALPLLLAFLAGCFWLYRKWKRRVVAVPAPVIQLPRVTAADIALARLQELEAAGWIDSSDPEGPRTFAFILSEILREYLGARFGIDALEATTSELLQRTASLALTPEQHVWLGEVSVELDTVKFATGRMTLGAASHLLGGTRAFVRQTDELNESPEASAPREEAP
jgi:hypothetical protein